MIRITDTTATVKVDGHARREVCAMVTALTMAFVQNVTEETGKAPTYTVEDGYFFVDAYQFYKDNSPTGKLLMRCLQRNLKQLAMEYPKDITHIQM
jgi:uncharacterized protein YsxB (DUF464 family)